MYYGNWATNDQYVLLIQYTLILYANILIKIYQLVACVVCVLYFRDLTFDYGDEVLTSDGHVLCL